jgi:hypothetical protein
MTIMNISADVLPSGGLHLNIFPKQVISFGLHAVVCFWKLKVGYPSDAVTSWRHERNAIF